MSKRIHPQIPQLRLHLLSLGKDERETLASNLCTTTEYLYLCAGGWRRLGKDLATQTAKLTGIEFSTLRHEDERAA